MTLTVPGSSFATVVRTGARHDRTARPADAEPTTAPSRYELVDCDVHPIMKGGMGDLRPYLSRAAQRRLGLDERRNLTTVGHREAVSIPRNMLYVNQAGVLRDDARAPDGSAPGRRPGLHRRSSCSTRNGIDRAVLIGGEVLGLGAMPDPDAAAIIASAYNDWLAATWLAADDRYRGNLVVGAQDPLLAAQEIRRAAAERAVRRACCCRSPTS